MSASVLVQGVATYRKQLPEIMLLSEGVFELWDGITMDVEGVLSV